jgi:hypothetical protein
MLLKKDTLRFYPQYLIKLVGSGSVDCEIGDNGDNAVGIASVTAFFSVRICEYLYINGTFSAMDVAKLVLSRELMLCFEDGDGDWADEFFYPGRRHCQHTTPPGPGELSSFLVKMFPSSHQCFPPQVQVKLLMNPRTAPLYHDHPPRKTDINICHVVPTCGATTKALLEVAAECVQSV